MRHMLMAGPFPWEAIGVLPGDWRDCEVHESLGEADALRRLRASAYDVIVTSPVTPASRDLAMVAEARECQPGIRTIVIAPELTPGDIITALRSEVFSCFAMPVSADELRDAIAQALDAEGWKNGIEVISALPTWIALRVACRRVTADRLTRFIVELAAGLPDLDRNDLATAFREMLLNAMEHGAGFDALKVIEVAAIRTERTIVYYFKDPGPGFNPKAPGLVATDDNPMSHLAYREAEGKRPGGFGMLLTAKLVDEVQYSERGNEVFLVKHLDKLRGRAKAPARVTAKRRVLPFGQAPEGTARHRNEVVEIDQES
jgi:anti-sigma regulatory factor (Ser/Thr protein kinase)